MTEHDTAEDAALPLIHQAFLDFPTSANGDVGRDFRDLSITVDNVFEAIIGFANGTSAPNGPSMDACTGFVDRYVTQTAVIMGMT